MNDDDQDLERIKKAVAELGEHFDCVQIFAARHEPATHDGTLTFQFGSGCFFTRYGFIKLWVERQEERERICTRKQEEEDNR